LVLCIAQVVNKATPLYTTVVDKVSKSYVSKSSL